MFNQRFLKCFGSDDNLKICAVIVAAGSGKRMGARENKVFLELMEKPVLAYTLSAFQVCDIIDNIVIVTRECDMDICRELVKKYDIDKVSVIVTGGATRQESVYNGLKAVEPDTDIIAVHDGARALIEPECIAEVVENAIRCGASAVGVKSKDTLKMTDADMFIISTVDRESVYNIQTPQTFKTDIIMSAHEYAREHGIEATDDCALVEMRGGKIKITEGSYDNIKLTTPEDLSVAENILKRRETKCV